MLDEVLASLRTFYAAIATGADASRTLEREGVLATINPATPERSFFNSVVCRDATSLGATYDALAATYQDAGVRAWTVWIPEADTDAAALVERAGHRLDGQPRAMLLELDGFTDRPRGDVVWSAPAGTREIATLNEQAYGVGPGEFEAGLEGLTDADLRRYVVFREGAPISCLCTIDRDSDCHVTFVATSPEARGQGLATALMLQAIVDARERGCVTSTLVATAAGYPIYERLGFRDLGAVAMWERRAGDR